MSHQTKTRAGTAHTPVAVIGPVWTLLWASSKPVAEIAEQHGLTVGSRLYGPAVAAEAQQLREQRDELLAALRKAHHCIKNGVCFDYEGMQQVGYRTEWDQEADKLADDAAALIARVEAA